MPVHEYYPKSPVLLVSAVAAQPSARNPHEIEESSVGQPQVKWRKERVRGVDGQGYGGIFRRQRIDTRNPASTGATGRKSSTDKG
jgi:hypothetical protein